MISSQSSLLDPLDHPHWSLSFNCQFTPVSRPQTTFFGMLHLICGTSFLLPFVFHISLVHHHQALLHHQALILDQSSTFLMAFSTFVLKRSFTQNLSLHSPTYCFLGLTSWNLTTWCLAVSSSGSVSECGRLCLYAHCNLLTYWHGV